MPGPSASRTTWYADGLAFSCRNCGACCGGAPGDVWVADEEVAPLAAALDMSEDAFLAECVRTRRGGRLLKERANWDCILLDPVTRRCRAYEARPLQCRLWPWWQQNLASPEAWAACKRDCPGVGEGPVTPPETIDACLAAERERYGDW